MRKYEFRLKKDDLGGIKKVFKVFDNGTGHINPSEVAENMRLFRLDKKNPVAYKLICDLEKDDNAKNGVDYEDMIDFFNSKLADRKSDEAMDRAFTLVSGDPEKNVITYQEIHRTAQDTGNDLPEQRCKEMMGNIAKNGNDMEYEEFCSVMTKNVKL